MWLIVQKLRATLYCRKVGRKDRGGYSFTRKRELALEFHTLQGATAELQRIKRYYRLPRLQIWEEEESEVRHDPINHPKHYTSHPSGVECITIVECLTFTVGAAIKYLWRAGLKVDRLEDLQKARWYVSREIDRVQRSLKRSGRA